MALPDGSTLRGLPADVDTGAAVLYEITGRVRGSLPERADVRAVLKTLQHQRLGEEIVAEAPVDATGSYRLVFERPDASLESADASLTVRLYSRDGALLVEST